MASNAAIRSPVLRTVVNAIQKLYPQTLANKTWDNTGLLLEAPFPTGSAAPPPPINRILLAIDLTRAVANEAISHQASVIISYHPIIFRPLKSLTLANTQQETLLRLAQEGISVYSPHTAVDAAIGGVNDWLADGVSGGMENEESRSVIEPVEGAPGGEGMGRFVELKQEVRLEELFKRVKAFLSLKYLSVCYAQSSDRENIKIKTIAICAGAGSFLFKGITADLLFTGELPHHDALAAIERGTSVITCFHTNTERGFLKAVMKPRLERALQHATDARYEVVVSVRDEDPFWIV